MGFFDFLGGGVIEAVGKVADDLITSDEERAEKENEKLKAELSYKAEMAKAGLAYEAELTKRLQSDNKGNFLTRSARPITLYIMLTLIGIMIFGNMFGITIDDKYLDMVQILAMTVFSFYFGGKSIEAIKHGKIL
jgi:uncharacterized protein YjbJ (UPF0337 family)